MCKSLCQDEQHDHHPLSSQRNATSKDCSAFKGEATEEAHKNLLRESRAQWPGPTSEQKSTPLDIQSERTSETLQGGKLTESDIQKHGRGEAEISAASAKEAWKINLPVNVPKTEYAPSGDA